MAYPGSYRFTKDHEWIDLQGDRGRVGITDYAQQQLGDVVYIELPAVGTRVEAGQPFGSIESVKAVSDLFAPVSGEIVEVNTTLKDRPEVINADPHGTWMIVLKVSDPSQAGSLLDAAQYGDLVK
jgi:glycine cleavage system H protein